MSVNPEPGASSSPIADLTYRAYIGPLNTRTPRWWVVARLAIRMTIKRWQFWLLALFALMPFLMAILQLYIVSNLSEGQAEQMIMGSTPKYAAVFLEALGRQVFWMFLMALMIGSGSIATDNRANALLIYLSKPVTKRDYLFGKWMGVFLVLFGTAFASSLLLYLYCLLSYVSEGFLRSEPWLILQIAASCFVPAAVLASVILGFSAWAKSSMMAGGITAGVYFGSVILALVLWLVIYNSNLRHGNLMDGTLVRNASIPGVIYETQWDILNVTEHAPFMRRMRSNENENVSSPTPKPWIPVGAVVALSLAGVVAARSRIRAVEVIKG